MSGLALLIAMGLGCGSGGGGGSEEDPEFVRIINAAPNSEELDIEIDDEAEETTSAETTRTVVSLAKGTPIRIDDLEYSDASAYTEVLEGERTIIVRNPNSATPLINEAQTVEKGKAYTYVIAEEAEVLTTVFQEDNLDGPSSGNFRVRLANFSESVPSADVYIVKPDTEIDELTPASAALALKAFSDYVEAEAGTWEVMFTEAASKTAVETIEDFEFAAGSTYTIMLFDKAGGGDPVISAVFSDL